MTPRLPLRTVAAAAAAAAVVHQTPTPAAERRHGNRRQGVVAGDQVAPQQAVGGEAVPRAAGAGGCPEVARRQVAKDGDEYFVRHFVDQAGLGRVVRRQIGRVARPPTNATANATARKDRGVYWSTITAAPLVGSRVDILGAGEGGGGGDGIMFRWQDTTFR